MISNPVTTAQAARAFRPTPAALAFTRLPACKYTDKFPPLPRPARRENSVPCAAARQEIAMASVEERVKQIIVEQLGVDEAEVTPTASFVDDLGADSLDQVELVMAFEEAFGIEVPDEDAEKMTTVKDAVEYISKNAKVTKQ